MAFPTQALLHRLREQVIREATDVPWVAYAPARFFEVAGVEASRLAEGSPDSSSAGTALPGNSLDLLVSLSGSSSGSVAGKVWSLSLHPRGCREVQQALEEASDDKRCALARELQGHIREASRCPHANYVVQKCITIMAPNMLQFIIDEIVETGSLLVIARHKYGCRIIQRLIEHCPGEQMRSLVEILFEEFLDISRHAYGNFVVQNLLQHLAQDQRSRLVELVEKHVLELASHQHGCAVLGAALEHGDLADKCRLAEMVLEDSDQVSFMAGTKHGRSIITNLLHALDGTGCRRLLALLEGNLKLEEVLQCRSEEGTCTSC